METAKLENTDSALESIKAKQIELSAEGNQLGKLVETPVPGTQRKMRQSWLSPGSL